MQSGQMEQLLRNVDSRVEGIEQILPTLATKDDLQRAIEPLPTKAELLATRVELLTTREGLQTAIAETEQRMRTHFDIVTESLRDDIQLIATGLATLSQRGQ